MDFFEKHEISRPSRPYTERDFNSRIPRYNDDSDYTTNAPSYYDDLARKNQLLKTLSYRIWEYQEVINKQFNEWDEQIKEYFLEWQKNLEEFDEEVMKLLRQWMEDGTMADLINETLLNMKADKTYVDSHISRIDIELNKKLNKNLLPVNLKDFGAKGDGKTDDSNALTSALNHLENNGGGKLLIPEGRYYTEGVFDVPGNVTIEGVDGQTYFTRDDQSMMFRINGSFGTPHSVIQNSELGDHFITVGSPEQFSIGDYIRIVSQRNALSEDAHEDFYLGHSTAETHAVYFGEYRRISSINNDTGQLFFRGGLIFPDYLTHNNNETNIMARRSATVEKANFVENVIFKNLIFDGKFSNAIRFDKAVNCYVDNIHGINIHQGDFVTFHNSLNCEGRHSTLSYTPNFSPPNHYSRNGFKTVSSDNCGFDNIEVFHGTQCVDFTYTTNENELAIPNTNSYLINSKIRQALFNTMTSHPGCLNVLVSDNIMTGSRQDGIFSRARKSVISNNIVEKGSGDVTQGTFFGIQVSHDSSINCIVTGNSISGYEIGVRTHDNVNTEIKKLNLLISNNTITRANRGIQLRRNSGSTFTGNSNVFIRGNTFSEFAGEFAKLIDIYDRYFNIFIEDNFFEINNNVNGGIFTRGNASKIFVNRNIFSGNSTTFYYLWFDDVTDSDIPSKRYSFEGNRFDSTTITDDSLNLGNLSNQFSNHYFSHLLPHTTNKLSLGTPSTRWRYLYSQNAPDVVSDERLKENIESEVLGLDTIEQLNPVSYTMKENSDGVKHGLIAQEVEKIITDGSIVRKPDDETEYYSMQYEQLIPIIIKAIQELNDKIKGE